MILVDEHAESELVAFLESFRLAPDYTTRCLHFMLTPEIATPALKQRIIAAAQQHLSSSSPRIYFCDSGDIVILGESIPSRSANLIILDVVDHIARPADERWVMFRELAFMTNALLVRLQPILEQQQQRAEEALRLAQQQQQARKRAAILSAGANIAPAMIHAKRSERPTIELMMIEDDAFSRRLVENVLQKKYALTSLADTSIAIETYARVAPDLLFLDINLPDVTGHELLARLLMIDPEAHIIMLSGNADQQNIVEAMRHGAKGFIAKPFTKEKLFQYIERCAGIAQKLASQHA